MRAPAHVLFPQLVPIVERYREDKVDVRLAGRRRSDLFLSPYYGWASSGSSQRFVPDTSQGEAPEVPRYETSRGPGRRRTSTSGRARTCAKW